MVVFGWFVLLLITLYVCFASLAMTWWSKISGKMGIENIVFLLISSGLIVFVVNTCPFIIAVK